MSRSLMTARMGSDPALWTFLGQCYETSPGSERQCAITYRLTRVCFTLKRKDGQKGRLTVSAEAIPILEPHNPELYVKLKVGLMSLEIRRPAIQADTVAAALRRRLQATQSRFETVRAEARQRVQTHRRTYRREQLPEYLEIMRSILGKPGNYFDRDEARLLALEQRTAELERHLVAARDADPVKPDPVKPDPIAVAPQPVVARPFQATLEDLDLPDIPEIEF